VSTAHPGGGGTAPASTDEFLTRGWMERWMEAAATDPELRTIAARSRFTSLWRCGDRECLLSVEGGRLRWRPLEGVDDGWDFSLEAPPEVWRAFLSAAPPRHHHDLLAMWMRVPGVRLDGNRRLILASARVLRRLGELARLVSSGEPEEDPPAPEPPDGLEPVVGRYLWLGYRGRRYRVYFEEAGLGVPLLLLHTAGADSRLFAHLLNDPDYTRRWRLVAFDLPGHGRSLPPDGWWEREYRLTTAFYAGFVVAFARALRLERPLVLGCSMGGEIVLELALRHPDRFRGVIGCESSEKVSGRRIGWTHHPEVNASEAVPAWVEGLMAPRSPRRHRKQVWFVYSQAAAGVFNGDIAFYNDDWDGRGRVARIDTARCPVHLMTGEYDYSCTLEMSRATAERIPGARFHPMPGLGHFPMAENPARFKRYLLPVLEELSGDAQVVARSEEGRGR
jgi:pimeloyl-ACP methyl ester carboxylesterase